MTSKVLYKTVLLIFALNVNALAAKRMGMADEYKQRIVDNHDRAISQLLQSENIPRCLATSQNPSVSLQDILKIDQMWPGQPEHLHRVLEHPCTALFKQLMANPAYHFSEIMLADQWGALVAAYPRPGDYWQADEQKFIQPTVTGQRYISEESWDTSTGTFSFFITVPVVYAQHFAGVLITGINVTTEYLDKLSLQELLIIEVSPEAQSDPSQP